MKIKQATKELKRYNKWRRGARDSTIKMGDPYIIGVAIDTVLKQLETISLKEAYEILKKNTKYSSGTCPGFVYLSQIEELLK